MHVLAYNNTLIHARSWVALAGCARAHILHGTQLSAALVPHLLKLRDELGQERRCVGWVVNQLGHVVNDDTRLTLDGGGTLTQTTHQQGHDDGERGSLDLQEDTNTHNKSATQTRACTHACLAAQKKCMLACMHLKK